MINVLSLCIAGLSDALLPSAALADYTKMASALVLDGQDLPKDYREHLLALSPADRVQAIAFLRRAGLLSDDHWTLADLLREADPQDMAPQDKASP